MDNFELTFKPRAALEETARFWVLTIVLGYDSMAGPFQYVSFDVHWGTDR